MKRCLKYLKVGLSLYIPEKGKCLDGMLPDLHNNVPRSHGDLLQTQPVCLCA